MELREGLVELKLELEIENTGGSVLRDVISGPLEFLMVRFSDFQLIL